MDNHTARGFAVAIGFLMLAALSSSANATTLRSGSTGATVTGARPGQVLWTNYHLFADDDFDYFRDTIIRLVNPNGGANIGITGNTEQPVCAMMYVFDSAEEMESCCGCPISSAGMVSFSVLYNLLYNGVFNVTTDIGNGVIAVVAAAPNPDITTLSSPSNGHDCTVGQSGACNDGCDPTQNPGYAVSTTSNLLGSRLIGYPVDNHFGPRGLTEIQLFDDGSGDPNNLTYLKAECGLLVGNGSGAGICSCPVPGDSEPPPTS